MHYSLLDKGSLMLHEAIAAKVRADPSLLEKTRKWLSETVSNELFSQSVRDGYREWEQATSLEGRFECISLHKVRINLESRISRTTRIRVLIGCG
jgi:hypothetical protein